MVQRKFLDTIHVEQLEAREQQYVGSIVFELTIEEDVLKRINEVVTHPKVLKKLVDKVNKHKKEMIKPLQEELEANKQAIEKVRASRDKYLNLFDEKLIDQELLAERLAELNQEFERQVKRQSELEASLKGCDLEELSYEYEQEVMSHLNEILQEMPNDERKAIYHMIIEEVVVNQEKQIEMIKLKIDEEVQRDLIKQSPSEKQSDGDILIGCFSVNKPLVLLGVSKKYFSI